MNESLWRVLDGEGNEQGPYSFQDLQGFYTTGNINHDTMIWTEGLDQWVPAGRVEGLLSDVPKIVELAPAPVLTAAAPVQVAPVASINLSPQIFGVALPGAPAPARKNPAPTWVSILTIVTGLAALILFFLPWVSLSMDLKIMGDEGRIKTISQTGIQTITKRISTNDDFQIPLKKLGIPEKEADKMVDDVAKEMDDADTNDGPYDSSILVMICLIAVGLGLIFALIGLVNKAKTLVLIAQVLFVIGAILVSFQMAQQFPAMEAAMDEQRKELEAPLAQASSANTGEKNEAATPAEIAKEKNQQEFAEKQLANVFQTKFEPSCFATVGLLGFSLLLLVVTMSSGGYPPITIPQPGTTPLQPQPVGIRFQ